MFFYLAKLWYSLKLICFLSVLNLRYYKKYIIKLFSNKICNFSCGNFIKICSNVSSNININIGCINLHFRDNKLLYKANFHLIVRIHTLPLLTTIFYHVQRSLIRITVNIFRTETNPNSNNFKST